MARGRVLLVGIAATLAAGSAAACVVGIVVPLQPLPLYRPCPPYASSAYWAGWNAPLPPPPVAPLEPPAEPQREPAAEKPRPAKTLPPAGAQVDLAWRFIGLGDTHFANQRFRDASDRYRKAKMLAPQLAAAHIRHAFSLAAAGRYDFALSALKRGLELDRTWPQSDFRLAQLYADNHLAKVAHLDALAQQALDTPDNGDLLFFVGVYLWFDGQRERAAPFFRRARTLTQGPTGHIDAFLNVE